MATRTAAPASAGSGAAGAGARPAFASASNRPSWLLTSASSRPPTTAAPRSGDFQPTGRSTVDARWATANERACSPRYRPGTYSSITTWKLVPPKPNALTPPERAPPGGGAGHPRSEVVTRNGVSAQSTFGFGSTKFRLGASTLWCRLIAILNSPAVPAAPLRWPMLDFTEPSATEPGAAPALANTSVRLDSSAASPTRVEVP